MRVYIENNSTVTALRFLSFLLSFVLCINIARAEVRFDKFTTTSTNSQTVLVAAQDITGDGKSDIVAVNGTSGQTDDYSIVIFTQSTNGSLNLTQKISYKREKQIASSIALADVDNDGRTDIILGFDAGIAIGIAYQQTSGLFANPIFIQVSSSIQPITSICTNDFTADNLQDIAIYQSNCITIAYQKSDKTFGISQLKTPTGSINGTVISTDIDRDKKNDIILTSGLTRLQVASYTHEVTSELDSFTVNYTSTSAQQLFGISAVEDLNVDGFADVATIQDTTLSILFYNPKNKIFTNKAQTTLQHKAEAVYEANLNCYTGVELIAAYAGEPQITIIELDSTLNYTKKSSFEIPTISHFNSNSIAFADVTGDDMQDIIIAGQGNGLILLNNKTEKAPDTQRIQHPEGDIHICNSDYLRQYIARRINYDKISWYISPTSSGKLKTSSADTCSVEWDSTRTNNAYIYSSFSNSCFSVFSDSLEVDFLRKSSFSLGHDTALCNGQSLQLSVNKNHHNLQWQDGSTQNILSVTNAGSYYIKIETPCGIVGDTINIKTMAPPAISVNDSFLCNNSPIKIQLASKNEQIFSWSDGVLTGSREIKAIGTYTVQTQDNYRCTNSKTITISNINSPKVLLPTDTTICSNDTINLSAYNHNCTYRWNNGSVDSVLRVDTAGVFAVTVSNECASVTRSCSVKEKYCDFYLDVPTAFSPNGDNLNDIFFVKGNSVSSFSLKIINRWGETIFATSKLEQGWDGTYKGEILEPAQFVYFLTGTSMAGESISKQGTLTLIR